MRGKFEKDFAKHVKARDQLLAKKEKEALAQEAKGEVKENTN